MCQGNWLNQYKSRTTLGKVSGTSEGARYRFSKDMAWRSFLMDIWNYFFLNSSCIKVLADPSFCQLRPLRWCQESPKKGIFKEDGFPKEEKILDFWGNL